MQRHLSIMQKWRHYSYGCCWVCIINLFTDEHTLELFVSYKKIKFLFLVPALVFVKDMAKKELKGVLKIKQGVSIIWSIAYYA